MTPLMRLEQLVEQWRGEARNMQHLRGNDPVRIQIERMSDQLDAALSAMKEAQESEALRGGSVVVVRRVYWANGNPSYRHMAHDGDDKKIDHHHLLASLLGVGSDGDEIIIRATRTGKRPFGNRRYILLEPHVYGPETLPSSPPRTPIETEKK
jgi:hypothetical protein